MIPRVIDYVSNNVAYYFPEDRNYPLKGYKKITYKWECLFLRQKGVSNIFVKGNFFSLLAHWNSIDHRWRYDVVT